MIRNLKAQGLALMAVFTLTAMAASTASAQQGTLTSDGPVTLIGTETGEPNDNSISMFGTTIRCPGSTYTAHKYNVTPHTVIPSGATTATITPHYNPCEVPGVGTATIDMNGCDFVLHLGETTGGVAGTYGVTADVVCPAGKQIEITIWTSGTPHTNATFCSIDFPAQTGLKGAHATDTGNGHIDIKGTFEGITATKTLHGGGLLCPHQHTAEAKFNIDVTVKGSTGGTIPPGTETKISLSHP